MATLDACPLDSRRGETEVFIKRVAVMVTACCLLGHLNSLRGIQNPQRLQMCIFLFIFNPVYPLLTLLFDIAWVILKAHRDARQRYNAIGVPGGAGPLAYYIAAAIGVHAAHNERNFDGIIEKTSTSLLRLPPSATQVERAYNTPCGTKQIGRLIVLGAVAVQCSGTIILGIRREVHGDGAATPSDRRYYLFAVSGMVILAQTLVAQLLSSTYTLASTGTSTANVEEYGWTVFIEVLHYIGSLCLISFYAGDGILNSSLLLAAMFALNPFLWPYSHFFGEFDWSFWRELLDNPMDTIWYIFMFTAIALGIPVMSAVIMIWMFVLASYNPYSDHFTDFSGVPAPTDVPCPSLWKDPWADKLWVF